MIRSSFILIFAAYLTGYSFSASEVPFPYDYGDYNYVEDYDELFRNLSNSTADSIASNATDATPKTNLGNTTEVPSNGTDPKPTHTPLMTKMQYVIYNRGYRGRNDFDDFPKLDPNKDTYILIPGYLFDKSGHYSNVDYQKEFYHTLGSALLYYCDCNVVGVKWYINSDPHRMGNLIRGAITVGRKLGKVIYKTAVSHGLKKPVTVIGHHLGNVAATALTDIARRPVRYVYALDQVSLPAPFRHYYIRQDASYLVQTITTGGFKRNYGHRNFYPNGGNYSSIEYQCFYCQSFRLLSDSLRKSEEKNQCTFCSNYGSYVENLCEYFPVVSYFNKDSPEELPYGNYFCTEDILSQ